MLEDGLSAPSEAVREVQRAGNCLGCFEDRRERGRSNKGLGLSRDDDVNASFTTVESASFRLDAVYAYSARAATGVEQVDISSHNNPADLTRLSWAGRETALLGGLCA
jgi:hypothetical protein